MTVYSSLYQHPPLAPLLRALWSLLHGIRAPSKFRGQNSGCCYLRFLVHVDTCVARSSLIFFTSTWVSLETEIQVLQICILGVLIPSWLHVAMSCREHFKQCCDAVGRKQDDCAGGSRVLQERSLQQFSILQALLLHAQTPGAQTLNPLETKGLTTSSSVWGYCFGRWYQPSTEGYQNQIYAHCGQALGALMQKL